MNHDDPGGNPLPLPGDPEWEPRMRALLEGTEYDTELGLDLARDAQRLVAGEISETAFHERHHDAVVEEFGDDERPTAEALDDETEGLFDSFVSSIERLADGDELDRREMLKKSGAVAGAASLGVWASTGGAADDGSAGSVAEEADEESETQWGMVIDLDKCDGCLSCVVGCSQENDTGPGENWMYVFTYEDEGQDDENFLVRTCQMCSNAPCEKVCPTTARHTRTEDGLVLTDYDVCIGCRYCQVACPYGVNYFQWGEPETPQGELDPDHVYDARDRWVDSRPPKGVMGKCTMCPSRQDGKQGEEMIGTTACEDACTMDAIHFGDMNDPDSDPNRYLERVREENLNDLDQFPDRSDDTVSTFRLLEELGTEPNVVFVGNEPGPNARQVEGPVAYEDIGAVDERKEVLNDGTVAGGVSS
ncbi:4Fe-4S ferredoxin N-terminal domain-containing protein [Natronorarus salvus]|uniref:4Fe-4S ferredoxin N-terminal domain-containing protein n=1 Tax=Natronorarus salvus TaxID=3117733 RepID=UPI002F26BF25